jgi:hypothetical protein
MKTHGEVEVYVSERQFMGIECDYYHIFPTLSMTESYMNALAPEL